MTFKGDFAFFSALWDFHLTKVLIKNKNILK